MGVWRGRGFTLVELLVAVTLIGVLSAIALPTYREYIRRAQRVDAQKSLVELAQFLERYHTSRGTYLGASLPFDTAPREGGVARYRLGFAEPPQASSYRLQAAPLDTMAEDACGVLTLASSGLRGAAAERCW
ncbi:type IV pilin protein [Pseudomonas sp. CAN2814]|uniref:type IV pilin protein n=1 Tax=Pseudomonas sp. CAN1 TaxID=3046726 RepID=UPI002649317B|nr:type IV pilin protein [Pseudomonas sp. CAN1]MDN6855742.1 type IV pilin protein [Pseudomonas sp. CAN1]